MELKRGHGWQIPYADGPLHPDYWYKTVWYNAKKRAEKKGVEFTIKPGHVWNWAVMDNGRCSVTGIPFDFSQPARGVWRRPFVPSLDRINPNRGYTVRNTRLVVYAFNAAVNQWGEDTFRKMAEAYTQKWPAGEDSNPEPPDP
jgi:hypothetical protein